MRYVFGIVSLVRVVSTNASDFLEILVSKITYYVSSGTYIKLYSLTLNRATIVSATRQTANITSEATCNVSQGHYTLTTQH